MLGAIIQARIGSTRLPAKVVEKIEDRTVLEHVIARTAKIKSVKKVIVATTDKEEDDVLEGIIKNSGADLFRGSEEDVLDRYYQAARLFGLDPVIRITSDCPLLDPGIAEKVVEVYSSLKDCDYASNSHPPTFPDGMDVEIFSFKSLEKSWKEAKLPSEREHVTSYMAKNPQIFKMLNLANGEDLSNLRMTLDEKEDLTVIKRICKELYKTDHFFSLGDILSLIREKPELMEINRHIKRNEGYIKSLKKDEKYGK